MAAGPDRYDVAIIGAGTAGLAAERAARKNGASTVLIDPAFAGTTCATVGCMPSKLLIAAAREAHRIGRAGLFGIDIDAARVDGPAVLRRVRAERDRFAALTRESIESLPDGVAIRETVFELADLPRRLAVIGSGAIGLELAQAFAHLGVEVALFDRADRVANIRCPKVQATLRDILERDLDLHLGVGVVARKHEHGVHLSWSGRDQGDGLFDKVLVAVGRHPQIRGLDLDRAGV
ncbi:MAG: FAD-dependent oxidoreductase [Roseomonas mucosa]|nr:FAD-dependent oxidoreductase [Roseomonas mucosa]